MPRLTAVQLGRLAEHVESAIQSHPLTRYKEPKKHTALSRDAWEVDLEQRISADPQLPTYEDVQEHYDVVLDQLIAWFSEG